MYWAVLNQIRMGCFLRTNVSTVNAVTPLTNIGHGCSKSMMDVINGTNATELFMFAKDILKKEVSQRTASAVNATNAFQETRESTPGITQGRLSRNQPAAAVTAATQAWIR